MKTRHMFNRISRWYDFLNHLLSAGQDILWRKRAVERLLEEGGEVFLDVATGTADVAFEILRQKPEAKVFGLDPAINMLKVAKEKMLNKGKIFFLTAGEGENLPFPDASVDGITIAFGIRNVEDRRKTLSEFHRVLKPKGTLVILEFSKPRGIFGLVYEIYFNFILPILGWLISGDREAYTYLPRSVAHFPSPNQFAKEILRSGFESVLMEPYTLGICHCYKAVKKGE